MKKNGFLQKNKMFFLLIIFLLLSLSFVYVLFFTGEYTNYNELYNILSDYNLSDEPEHISILCYLDSEDEGYCFDKKEFNFTPYEFSQLSDSLYNRVIQTEGKFFLLNYNKFLKKWFVRVPGDNYTEELIKILEGVKTADYLQGEVILDERNFKRDVKLYSFDLNTYIRVQTALLRYYQKSGLTGEFTNLVSRINTFITTRDPSISLVFSYPISRKDLDYICPLLTTENCDYLKRESELFFESLMDSLSYSLNMKKFTPNYYVDKNSVSYAYIKEVFIANSYILGDNDLEQVYGSEILKHKKNIEENLNMNAEELLFKVDYLGTIGDPVLNYFYLRQDIDNELSFVLYHICSNVNCGNNFEIANFLLRSYE
jgi:hypothetical protein